MQVEIKIDENCVDPKIIIVTPAVTDEISEIIKRVSKQPPASLVGFKSDLATILEPESIIRVYAAHQKVYVTADSGEYIVRQRLYEIEERLNSLDFVRISNSEIINFRRVKSFDLGLSGTICVKLRNGSITYVSRRYVTKIKKVLGK